MSERELWTPPQLAKHWGVSVNKVLFLITTGELEAFNLATDPNGKLPRWRIHPEAVSEFERRRMAVKPAVKRKRRSFDRRAITNYF